MSTPKANALSAFETVIDPPERFIKKGRECLCVCEKESVCVCV